MTRRAMFVLALLGGCGDSDDGGGGSSTGTVGDQTADSLCEEYCAHAVDCGWDVAATCDTDCQELADVVRGDMLTWIADCANELACTENPATCWDEADNQFTTSDAQAAYIDACRARMEDCGVGDDLIGLVCDADRILVVSDEAIADLEACFDVNCDEIGACTDQVVDGWNL